MAAGLSSFTATHHQGLDLARHPGKRTATHTKLRAKDRPLLNDFVTDEHFVQLLRAWFGNIARVLLPGHAFWIWGGYANCANYPPVLKACGLYFSQSVIWVKEHPVLTRKDMMGNHEWCFYGWREGAAHRWLGPNNVPDVWSVKKVNPQSMVHLTEKPVELAVRAITYTCVEGDPTPVSTLADILFQTTLEGLRLQFLGGLSMNAHPTLYDDHDEAIEDAKNRLVVWKVARQIRADRGLPLGEVVRITLHDKDGRVLYQGDVR